MKSAKEMYDFCKENNFFFSLDRNWAMKYLNIIEENLMEDEIVLCCFIGIEYKSINSLNESFHVYALTNKRFVVGYKTLFVSKIKIYPRNCLENIRLKKEKTNSVLSIITPDKQLDIFIADSDGDKILKQLTLITKTTPDDSNNNPNDIATKLMEMKSLLDEEFITRDEFNEIKKRLLSKIY